jgi:hypothetical protein
MVLTIEEINVLMTNVEESPVVVFMDPLVNQQMMMPPSCWGLGEGFQS